MEAIWQVVVHFQLEILHMDFMTVIQNFQVQDNHSVDKFSDWAAKRLGYPIVEVELQDEQFYACYEEAITEYSAQVNQFNIRDNMFLYKDKKQVLVIQRQI